MAHQDKPALATWIGFIGMVGGMFMAIMDIQIVASSISEIKAGLLAAPDEISWVQTAYLITEVIMIPLSGWLALALSTRTLFLIAVGGFTLMSLLSACAWNIDSMIVFRMMQGFLGGAMIPTVFATAYSVFPKYLFARVTIIVGLVVTMAPTFGPVLGGWLTQEFSWRALFLINIVPGLAVFWTTWRFVHFDQPRPEMLKKIDYAGIVFLALFLCCLQYVLEEGARKSWFSDPLITSLSALSAFGFFAMLYQELTTENPIIDLRAFKNRNFAVGSLYSFIIGFGLYSVVFLMPLYLGEIRGLNSLQIGSYIFVTGATQFISAPIAGILSKKIDLRLMLGIGLSLFGLGSWINGTLTDNSGFISFLFPQMLRGFSLMFCFLPINHIALGTLPPDEVKKSSGLYNVMRNLGGAIGLAIVNTQLLTLTKVHDAALRSHVTDLNQGAENFLHNAQTLLAQKMIVAPDSAALDLLNTITEKQAATQAFNNLFMMIAFVFWLELLFMPFIKKVKNEPEA